MTTRLSPQALMRFRRLKALSTGAVPRIAGQRVKCRLGRKADRSTNLFSREGEAMATCGFDDQNIKWSKLGELEHLLYSILNVDEDNKIIDVLFKFSANQQIVRHRHMVHNNTFVVQGEHRLYAQGKARKIHQYRKPKETARAIA
jgi:hypothetical protein